MKRVSRSRKGFTLAEIILVVAIIVILASVSFVGIGAMIKRANKNATSVELHAGAWYVEGSAGEDGYYPYLMGGTTKYVKVVPRGTPGAQYWSDWDEMHAQVDRINAITPAPQGGGYVPGSGAGGDPIGPGNGGGGNPVDPGNGSGNNSGGGNPGGGAQNPVNPDDPMWNGHPESWWDKQDAEIEKKIQEAINKGVNPDDIKVIRDPETGHITSYTIPSATSGGNNNSGSGAVTVPNTVTSGTGVKNYTNNSDGTTTVTLMLNTHNTGDVKIRDNGDGTYSIYCIGSDGKTVVGNAIGYTQDNQWCKENTWITLTSSDWNKLSTTYGFN